MEQLQEKIIQEIEILEAIFDSEGIVLMQPQMADLEASTNSSGHEDEDASAQAAIQVELDIRPNTGIAAGAKIGLLAHVKLIFEQAYPFKEPKISYVKTMGLDDQQFNEILESFNAA